jgi:hypothetical protein
MQPCNVLPKCIKYWAQCIAHFLDVYQPRFSSSEMRHSQLQAPGLKGDLGGHRQKSSQTSGAEPVRRRVREDPRYHHRHDLAFDAEMAMRSARWCEIEAGSAPDLAMLTVATWALRRFLPLPSGRGKDPRSVRVKVRGQTAPRPSLVHSPYPLPGGERGFQ